MLSYTSELPSWKGEPPTAVFLGFPGGSAGKESACNAGVKVRVSQSCPTLNPTDYTIHGILQARILEWVAFPFSRGSSQLSERTQVSRIAGGLFTSWATGEPKNPGVVSLPSPADLPDPGIQLRSPAGRVFTNWATREPHNAGDPDLILGLGRPMEEGMATHSSVLAQRIPWTEEPGGLQSRGSQRVGHD